MSGKERASSKLSAIKIESDEDEGRGVRSDVAEIGLFDSLVLFNQIGRAPMRESEGSILAFFILYSFLAL